MKNKIISTLMVSSILLSNLGGVTTAFATETTNQDMITQAVKQDTALTVKKNSDRNISYGESDDYVLAMLDTLYTITYNGQVVPYEELDVTYRFHDTGEHFFFIDEYLANHTQRLGTQDVRVGITVSLKSDPTIKGFHAVNGAAGVTVKLINKKPEIKTKVYNLTVYEGDSYQEWKNIEYSDYEDDRDGKELQRNVIYPEGFNKDNMQSGDYVISYRATDSQNATSTVTELLTVQPTFAPEIHANDVVLTAENREFDPLTDVKVSVIDGIDGDITEKLEVVSNNVDMRKDGDYTVTYRATSRNKTATKTVNVKIVSESPVLTASDIKITDKESINTDLVDLLQATATDKVDGDVTNNIRVKQSDVDFTTNGRYTVILAVTNSNGKITEKSVNVQISIPVPIKEFADLTIKYVDENGKEIAKPTVSEIEVGKPYEANALDIEGYNLTNDSKIFGTMTADGKIVTFEYKKVVAPIEKADLTIKYVDTNGKELSPKVVKSLEVGEEFTINALEIEGYTLIGDDKVSGTMAMEGKTVTFEYKENEKPVDPVDPIEPTEPVIPIDPIEPVEPTEPIKPIAPVKPVAPVEPKETTKPTEKVKDKDKKVEVNEVEEALFATGGVQNVKKIVTLSSIVSILMLGCVTVLFNLNIKKNKK